MSGSLADALTGAYLNASVGTVNTNVTNLGGSTRLGSFAGIDRGTISITSTNMSNTATVTSVTTSRSHLIHLGSTQRLDSGEHFIRIVLTNATTITATRDNNSEGTSTVSYELLEYNA
jgi:hypothetical protein